jgi:hypothetical protein
MTSLAEYNNNPGNIRPAKGVKYEGMIGVDDKGFAIFEKPEFGQKALVNDLTYKLEKRGIKTPSDFVDIYSPAGDENSEDSRDNYKIYIAQMLGLKSTKDPFPENAVERLSQAVTNFEGGTWQTPQKETPAAKSGEEPSGEYVGETVPSADTVSSIPTQSEKDRSAKEAAAVGSILGSAAGSVYTAKAPFVRLAQRVGILPGGKPITPQEAADLAERVMTPNTQAQVTPTASTSLKVKPAVTPADAAVVKHGGESWVKSLTGVDVPGGQMRKSDLDLAKGMQEAVGRTGEPGFVGGKITPGGLIISPQTAASIDSRTQELQSVSERAKKIREAQAALAQQSSEQSKLAEAAYRARMAQQQTATPQTVQPSLLRSIMNSAPVRGGMAGMGIGFNAQDAYNKFDQGDTLGGSLATGAAGASALGLVPRLASTMNPAAIGLTTASQIAGDLRQGNRQGAAESGLTGLAALFPRIFGPLGAAVYSGGLNKGEKEELERYREMKPPHLRP